jgi:preprotein translocase subunit SecF
MIIIKYKRVFFIITGVIVAAAIVSLLVFGLKASIEFTGGTQVEARYDVRPSSDALSASLSAAGVTGFSVHEEGDNAYLVRAEPLPDGVRANLSTIFSVGGASSTIEQVNEIGPTIGKELRNKSIIAVSLVLLCILLFIAFAFRKVSSAKGGSASGGKPPLSSWVYGAVALVGLITNVLVTSGFFALLGHYFGAQVDTLFVTALLTVVGFSVHDTIVVFDRVRENLRVNETERRHEDFYLVAGNSLNQTFVRSVNTSLTVVITLLILFFIGPASTEDFALTLLVGIVTGTYTSLCLSTPLLVAIDQMSARPGRSDGSPVKAEAPLKKEDRKKNRK